MEVVMCVYPISICVYPIQKNPRWLNSESVEAKIEDSLDPDPSILSESCCAAIVWLGECNEQVIRLIGTICLLYQLQAYHLRLLQNHFPRNEEKPDHLAVEAENMGQWVSRRIIPSKRCMETEVENGSLFFWMRIFMRPHYAD